jgi:hypothetical protein
MTGDESGAHVREFLQAAVFSREISQANDISRPAQVDSPGILKSLLEMDIGGAMDDMRDPPRQ